MKVPDFILRFFGRKVADKLDLQEADKMDTKEWYKSKTVIAGILAGLMGIYNTIATAKHLPPIPDFVYTILGAMGVYGRVTADTAIKS